MERLAEVAREGLRTDIPAFEPGDTVRVMVRVREGDKERLQAFEGLVIAKRGGGISENFTVRKVSAGVGVVMRHAQRAATGKPFSLRRLSFELPSVIGLGIMGGALGDWLGAAETVRWGLAATLGYLGPQVVEVVFYRWIARQDPS